MRGAWGQVLPFATSTSTASWGSGLAFCPPKKSKEFDRQESVVSDGEPAPLPGSMADHQFDLPAYAKANPESADIFVLTASARM